MSLHGRGSGEEEEEGGRPTHKLSRLRCARSNNYSLSDREGPALPCTIAAVHVDKAASNKKQRTIESEKLEDSQEPINANGRCECVVMHASPGRPPKTARESFVRGHLQTPTRQTPQAPAHMMSMPVGWLKVSRACCWASLSNAVKQHWDATRPRKN